LRPMYHLGLLLLCAAASPAHSSAREAPALSTPIDGPMDLAVDNHAHLFVLVGYENKVLRIDLRRNTITTFAGSGKECCYGDGAKADQVSLDPTAIAVDAAGDLFVADGGQIRKVDARTRLISTVAGDGKTGDTTDGAPAVSASFRRISGLTVDALGELFIADLDQDKVFRVDAKTRRVYRVAGNGKHGFEGDGGAALNASFRFIASIVFDKTGNLLIADSENCRVRRVNHETGIIESVAASGGRDEGCPPRPGAIPFVASPSDVAVSPAGDIYFLVTALNAVMRIDPGTDSKTGLRTTSIAAGSEPGFSGDGGPATKAQFSAPSGLAIDSSGNLFIADCGNQRVRRVDARTKTIMTIAGNGFPHVVHATM
jgi:trimeric autotransporter adhesin